MDSLRVVGHPRLAAALAERDMLGSVGVRQLPAPIASSKYSISEWVDRVAGDQPGLDIEGTSDQQREPGINSNPLPGDSFPRDKTADDRKGYERERLYRECKPHQNRGEEQPPVAFRIKVLEEGADRRQNVERERELHIGCSRFPDRHWAQREDRGGQQTGAWRQAFPREHE